MTGRDRGFPSRCASPDGSGSCSPRWRSSRRAGVTRPEPVVVFAAASLKNALDDATANWTKETGKTARISYAGSNALAKQIEAGAPADLFISADQAWMDYAEKAGTVTPGSRIDLLRNALVLIATARRLSARIRRWRSRRISARRSPGCSGAAASWRWPRSMPSRREYGKAAWRKLGAWDFGEGPGRPGRELRAALLLVARGEAPLGIVYATDAAAEPNVHVVATFPSDSHPPIIYPAALIKESRNPDAAPC